VLSATLERRVTEKNTKLTSMQQQIERLSKEREGYKVLYSSKSRYISGGATPGRARSNNLAGRFTRSTALAQALAPLCLRLGIALLR